MTLLEHRNLYNFNNAKPNKIYNKLLCECIFRKEYSKKTRAKFILVKLYVRFWKVGGPEARKFKNVQEVLEV